MHLRFLAYLAFLIGFSCAHAGSYEDYFGAIERDDAATIRQLFQRGFDPDTRDPKGQVGLYLALRSQSLKAAEAIAEHPRVSLDAANETGETPLMMAALRSRLDWCQRLVARGAKVHREGWTPLHYAAAGAARDVVAWFLAQPGVVIDARSPNGTTPLMMAAGYGTEDSAVLLLSRGADASLRNQKGMTAADFARSVGRESLAKRLSASPR